MPILFKVMGAMVEIALFIVAPFKFFRNRIPVGMRILLLLTKSTIL
ncbi:MAG: hypothetical protein JW795_14430 [Chitinivibrionales bacterium]|nr:hypothetical protein [Chitinivibrionales bacterium]